MRITLSMDATELLRRRTLIRSDFPEVWARFVGHQHIRHVRKTGQTIVQLDIDWHDATVVRNFYALWLSEHESAKHSSHVRHAIAALSHAIQHEGTPATRPVEHPV